MAGKGPVTDEEKAVFLDTLRVVPIPAVASRKIGRSLQTMCSLRDRNPDFAEQWSWAVKEGNDMAKAEVWRRAFEGTEEPVFQQGIKVGTVRKYSDKLAEMLMAGAFPETYSKRGELPKDPKDQPPGITDNELARKMLHILRMNSDQAVGLQTLIPAEKK